jgi:TonB family protein
MSVGPGTGAGGAVRGVEYLLYYNHMMTRIKESWAWAGQGGSLEAVVAFRITPAGEIVEVRTLHSSGDPTYDLSVERAVRGAGVLGPPPETYRSEFESGVEITFRAEDLRS